MAADALYQSAKVLGNNSHSDDNDSMRIAMLSLHTCPLATLGGKDTGGMNVYVRDLTKVLGRRGVGVDVFTRSQNEHIPHILHDLGYGNRVVHIPSGPEYPIPKPQLVDTIPEFVARVREFAASKGIHYDLIHSHYWLSGLAALDLRQIWDIPVIHMFHTLAEMKNRVARFSEETASDLRLQAEGRLLEEADRIITPTQAEYAQLQWLYHADANRIVVVPPGVDTARFYPISKDEAIEFIGSRDKSCGLLYVGRIEPLKGIDTLLEAMAIMKNGGFFDVHPKCLSVIGGDPWASEEELTREMERLQQLCSSLGIADMTVFLGKRDQDTLQYYYSAADVVVVPSHYESFGLVALEAMASGTPVVASETGGLAYLVKDGETGYHVPVGNPQALADRLMQILDNDELLARMGAQAAEYAKEFSWAIIVDQILEMYASVLAENRKEPA